MIVCPNCNHLNPEGAQACEACYTPLPATTSCPNCGAPVQTDARFCGQCGYDLSADLATVAEGTPLDLGDLPPTQPSLAVPEPRVEEPRVEEPRVEEPRVEEPRVEPAIELETPAPVVEIIHRDLSPTPEPEPIIAPAPTPEPEPIAESRKSSSINPPPPPAPFTPPTPPPPPPAVSQPTPMPAMPVVSSSKTQLQQQIAKLFHVQTNTLIELPPTLSVVHIGKPNDRIPPDVDVAGFPNSEIVSRIHADIRIEGDAYYIEDVGSSNGTYINNMPLLPGNRHRLRMGDRIALGKGDLVTFLFQLS
ncbi:FHA domain-containing protein [Chroococcidiopsis sp. FACHB-1243]|uniref:FHA domain-containing protein n=1 Tax=Chroococcidiopsis sp. [FACHB-1243] TaxID=2692781 RepID=UPI001781D258|nr:FHA domain-containing protein [Chroococcidiopsis sp. [FACHB-1243]]MBD2307181.1 FHA domain-containing protein [Chroococcidiopsis sp. [FACHB-1243]]